MNPTVVLCNPLSLADLPGQWQKHHSQHLPAGLELTDSQGLTGCLVLLSDKVRLAEDNLELLAF